jgi:hypothetical protein
MVATPEPEAYPCEAEGACEMRMKDILTNARPAGPDEVIEVGMVRDPETGNYERVSTTLRAFANLMLDELAARGVPIPPAPEKPKAEPPPAPEPGALPPTIARVIERSRFGPSDETVLEMWRGDRR